MVDGACAGGRRWRRRRRRLTSCESFRRLLIEFWTLSRSSFLPWPSIASSLASSASAPPLPFLPLPNFFSPFFLSGSFSFIGVSSTWRRSNWTTFRTNREFLLFRHARKIAVPSGVNGSLWSTRATTDGAVVDLSGGERSAVVVVVGGGGGGGES